ncbi:MAG: DNA starvation/stationary phase protection protein [Clostridiales bacterium]|nr:DNA starvation/stationary phase protection protein [Clostridiales bacterium]
MANLEKKLNQYVADLTVMYTKLHNVHWYVEGAQFFRMHELFEEYYDQVTADLDEVAERMLQIDMKPVGSLKGALELAKIEERDDKFGADKDLLEVVKKDFDYFLNASKEITSIASEAGDEPTADLMIGFTAHYEKALWMINALLK